MPKRFIAIFSSLTFLHILISTIFFPNALATAVAGNNITEPGEACDGTDLNGLTCATFTAGFKSGALSCRSDGTGFNLSQCVPGNIINAISCSQEDVQARVTAAASGDTIVIPPGDCTWTGSVSLGDTKKLKIVGAGIGSTILRTAPEQLESGGRGTHTGTGGALVLQDITQHWPVGPTGMGLLENLYWVWNLDRNTKGRVKANTANTITAMLENGTAQIWESGDHYKITRVYGQNIFRLGKSGSRVSRFTFIMNHHDDISIKTDGVNWRIDHNLFKIEREEYPTAVLVQSETRGQPSYGVMDHNEFFRSRPIVAPGNTDDHALWASDINFGTSQSAFIEDSTVTMTGFGNGMDANYGGKYVFRYNTVTNTALEAHSVQGNGRATRSWEIYNNKIIQGGLDQNTAFFLRGGTGVIFNNTLTGQWTRLYYLGRPVIVFDNVRDESRFVSGVGSATVSGRCDGGSPWDGNEPLTSGGSGAHTGTTGASVLQDTHQNWPVSETGTGLLVGNWVYNLTTGTKGRITANTRNTVTAESVSPSTGVGNGIILWTNAHAYKITNGHPCRDQLGRSNDQTLWTVANPHPPQRSDPAYIWNNKVNGLDVGAAVGVHIQPGRDYYIDTPKPGYVPYVYPHPLAQTDSGGAPQTFTLTVNKSGNSGGTVLGTNIFCGTAGTDCSETVASGISITMAANPATGAFFQGWTVIPSINSGISGCSGNSPCSVVMNSNTLVTATFGTQPSGNAPPSPTGLRIE